MLLIIRESKISSSQKGGHNSDPSLVTTTDPALDAVGTINNNTGSGGNNNTSSGGSSSVYETKYELYCPDHEEYCNLNGMISSTHNHDPADTAADPTTSGPTTASAPITNSNIPHIHTSACHNSNSNNTRNPCTLQRQGTLVTKKRAITLTQAVLHESPQQNDPPLYNSSGKPITNRLKRYAYIHGYIHTCMYILAFFYTLIYIHLLCTLILIIYNVHYIHLYIQYKLYVCRLKPLGAASSDSHSTTTNTNTNTNNHPPNPAAPPLSLPLHRYYTNSL